MQKNSTDDLVSIIIPTFNRSHLIGKTLDSILTQTYIKWECIVVDDGSTDDTENLLRSYMQKDSRFRFLKRPRNRPKGANACRNFGFELSKGHYINWFDSDDLMHPDKFAVQVSQLKDSEYNFSIGQSEWFDSIANVSLGNRAPLLSESNNNLEDYIKKKIFWVTGSTLWKRDFLQRSKIYFDESLHQSQEYDFYVKVLVISPEFITVAAPLFKIIKHDNNLSDNIFESYLKITSHVRVRSKIIKSFHSKISFSTLEYLYRHIFNCYIACLKRKNLKASVYVFFHLIKTIKRVKSSKVKRLKFLGRMLILLVSFPFFSRGQKFMKFL